MLRLFLENNYTRVPRHEINDEQIKNLLSCYLTKSKEVIFLSDELAIDEDNAYYLKC